MKPVVRRQIRETHWFHIYMPWCTMSENQRPTSPLVGSSSKWHPAWLTCCNFTSSTRNNVGRTEAGEPRISVYNPPPQKRVFLPLSNLWATRQQRAQLSGCESVLIEQVNMLQAKILSYLASCGLLCTHAGQAFATVVWLNVFQGNIVAQLNVGFLFFLKVLKFT